MRTSHLLMRHLPPSSLRICYYFGVPRRRRRVLALEWCRGIDNAEMDASGARVLKGWDVKPSAAPLLRAQLEYRFQDVLRCAGDTGDEGDTEAAPLISSGELQSKWENALQRACKGWDVATNAVLVAGVDANLLRAARAVGCLTLQLKQGAPLPGSPDRADFVIPGPMDVREVVEDINGVSLRQSTSHTPPPERPPGL
eukprot:gene6020-7233_t